ncbi:MAG: Hsp33 family molecular chaperone HslO [Streptococcaceae bacterium]|jgi:molecular chaperone Hsp33|nr:Hsp33 family molecular chaperone HslO [Streptococcaceae bacterium]
MTDKIIRAMDNQGLIRAFVASADELVSEACERHETWSASSVALGRMLVGTLLLGENLKGRDKLIVKMVGNGSGGAIVAESNANGEVKGYIQNPFVDLKNTKTGEVFVRQATGNVGQFIVIKDMGLKTPYTGQIPFVTGEIGEEFTYYLMESEQTPSSVGLTVKLDMEDRVQTAGGFMVQVLPGASEDTIAFIEERIQKMPALSQLLKDEGTDGVLDALFTKGNYRILEEKPVRFKCDCSKEKFSRGIATLPKKEIEAMIEEDGQAEIVCHFCKNKYIFNKAELEEIAENFS